MAAEEINNNEEDLKGKGKELEVEGEEIHDGKKKKKGKKGKEEKEPPPPMVPFFAMFRYATGFDKFLMIVGTIASLLNGASMIYLLF